MPLTRPDHPRKVVEDQQAAGEDTIQLKVRAFHRPATASWASGALSPFNLSQHICTEPVEPAIDTVQPMQKAVIKHGGMDDLEPLGSVTPEPERGAAGEVRRHGAGQKRPPGIGPGTPVVVGRLSGRPWIERTAR